MKRSKAAISVGAGFFFLLAAMVLLLPLRLCVAALVAAAVHELSHLIALRVMRVRAWSIQIGAGGAKIVTEPMLPHQELICALAGPAGGLLLLSVSRWIPLCALFGAFQSAYNLLPVYPLDGGRILGSVLRMTVGQKAATLISQLCETLSVTGIFVVAVVGSFRFRLGVLPILFAAFLLHRVWIRKIPCKQAALEVQ